MDLFPDQNHQLVYASHMECHNDGEFQKSYFCYRFSQALYTYHVVPQIIQILHHNAIFWNKSI